MKKLILMGIIGSLAVFASQQVDSRPPSGRSGSSSSSEYVSIPPNPRCVIKGNISLSNGKKWYHLPGMEDYVNTRIDPFRGERWFCSEKEAIEAGWKKAPR
jgi:hypothetical protein